MAPLPVVPGVLSADVMAPTQRHMTSKRSGKARRCSGACETPCRSKNPLHISVAARPMARHR